ncbi:uncharacterized protein LOC141622279 [Silene latifolia]|uniref:uncharacterized protein LOC141622279 n=1 Tax=Silene latifolia TaxID=37657 RepID=UPI003D788A2B
MFKKREQTKKEHKWIRNGMLATTRMIILHIPHTSKMISNHINCHNYQPLTNYCPTLPRHQLKPFSIPSSSFTLNCIANDSVSSSAAAYAILGVNPDCSAAQLKAAFRAKVKEFHPDVRKNGQESDLMIRRVIQAYEMLSQYSRSEIIESEFLDPFDKPECEALDVFVNEIYCVGKGCPYSCVKQASYAFNFSSSGTARAVSQGHGEDYQVQLAVGQCPRSCIHYVTPSQRIILEELLDSIVDAPYDTSAERELLYGLIVKAKYENNRYQTPKKQPKESTEQVDWL